MSDVTSADARKSGIMPVGSQPIALAAMAFVLVLLGTGSVALWRTAAGGSPETDRVTTARQIQLRAVAASEQLVEKTKALELSQQESIDQLQALQDQMQSVRRLLAAQQNDARRLSDQIGAVAGAIDSLRQSFASVQATESSDQPQAQHATSQPRRHATKAALRKHAKSRT